MDFELQIMGGLNRVYPKTSFSAIKLKEAIYFRKGPRDMVEYISARTSSMKRFFLDLLNISEFQNLNHTSTKPFYAYGMVTSIDGGPIERECYVQNLEDQSSAPVKLNLEDVSGYSLFNGQFIALRGRNVQGNEFLVEKIYCLPTINTNVSKRGKLAAIIAKGPFTHTALEKVLSSGPTSVILFGPFTAPGDGYYQNYDTFISRIEELLTNSMDLTAVIVPSLNDNNFLKVFPQPFTPQPSSRLNVVSNPGLFYINEHLISVINVDVVDIIKRNEFYRPFTGEGNLPNSEDASLRASYHLAFQHSFMPVFPVDHPVAYGPWLDIEVAPDLLITASCNDSEWFSHMAGVTTVFCMGSEIEKYYSLSGDGGAPKYKVVQNCL